MDFPDLGLVQLAPRDLTGPGIEFYARRISTTFATESGGFTLPADQLSTERLFMLSWSFSLLRDADPRHARMVRWYLQVTGVDVQLFGQRVDGFALSGSILPRVDGSSPFLVVPGGKPMLFVADFNANAVGVHTLDGWIWGYSFPKGNVLSF